MPKAGTREARLGPNRTGIKTSPIDIEKMLAGMDAKLTAPSSQGDERALADLRSTYITEAEPVGSMPPPPTLKGAAKAGAKMLKGDRPQVFLDRLGERLAFERMGTRLYDALIAKCRAQGAKEIPDEKLVQFRNQEAKHFALVGECIERLGADSTVQTPSADLTGVESMGLMQVITDPKTSVAQSLHAILVAELADNAAWDELITLAQKLGQDEMVKEFTGAQEHEREHLKAVRKWHEQLTLSEAKL